MPDPSAAALPEPSPQEQALSESLAARIRAEIDANHGAIPFSRFMELVLYTPGLGYYSGAREKFGAAGDFVTAPELGNCFARCLARQCAEILERTGGDILEAGAGSGILAAELLRELARLGRLPRRYSILELSSELRTRQEQLLRTRVPQLLERVEWLTALPATGFRGLMFANELLDALPVERFRIHAGAVRALAVGWDAGRFVWREVAAPAAVAARIAPLGLAEGYESEVGLAAEGWVRSAADALGHGVLLFIDYGFPRAEFYHPDRSGGTLMCHIRQRAHPDPLVRAGLQDITSHVDFTAITAAGREAGLDLLGYTSQAMFLIGCGLDDVAAQAMSGDVCAQLTVTGEIKKLTLPHEMGELFKVIALGRGVRTPLRGFAVQDRRARL
jgi:SAM-dependent MidA family methyltransferase